MAIVKFVGTSQGVSAMSFCKMKRVTRHLKRPWSNLTTQTYAYGIWCKSRCFLLVLYCSSSVAGNQQLITLSQCHRPYNTFTECTEEIADCLLIPWPNSVVENIFVEIHTEYFQNCALEELRDPPPSIVFALVMTPICLIPIMVFLVVLKTKNGDGRSWRAAAIHAGLGTHISHPVSISLQVISLLHLISCSAVLLFRVRGGCRFLVSQTALDCFVLNLIQCECTPSPCHQNFLIEPGVNC